MSASRAKGTSWESACVAVLRDRGWPGAERRALRGALDAGDVTGIPGLAFECKAVGVYAFPQWLAEADREAANAAAPGGSVLPLVWAKAKGKTSPLDGFVVVRPAHMLDLLRGAGY
jgi:hypothetical protein